MLLLLFERQQGMTLIKCSTILVQLRELPVYLKLIGRHVVQRVFWIRLQDQELEVGNDDVDGLICVEKRQRHFRD